MTLVATGPDDPKKPTSPLGYLGSSGSPPITWKYLEAVGYKEGKYAAVLSASGVASVFIRDKLIATCTTRAEFRDFLDVADVAWEETTAEQVLEGASDERDWTLLPPTLGD